ncbi:MAG: DNA-directed RNA polymerase subunit H [Candidatus Diapherotrites archaeon]|nr:DNA-directed RNA polymerase subunit H [Candidatus Diapherotrites archaeon]
MALEKVSQHILVPKHEILSKEEADKLVKKYGISIDNMPKIKKDDPVVEEIGAKKGDILKITRKSPTAGEFVYYRIVE